MSGLDAAGVLAGRSSASTAYEAPLIECSSGAVPGGTPSRSCDIDWYMAYGPTTPTQHLNVNGTTASNLMVALTPGRRAGARNSGRKPAPNQEPRCHCRGYDLLGGGKSSKVGFEDESM